MEERLIVMRYEANRAPSSIHKEKIKMMYETKDGFYAAQYLRLALDQWVEDKWYKSGDDFYTAFTDGRTVSIFWLLDELEDCADVLPVDISDLLCLPRGATYGEAVGAIYEEIA